MGGMVCHMVCGRDLRPQRTRNILRIHKTEDQRGWHEAGIPERRQGLRLHVSKLIVQLYIICPNLIVLRQLSEVNQHRTILYPGK